MKDGAAGFAACVDASGWSSRDSKRMLELQPGENVTEPGRFLARAPDVAGTCADV